jgi:hypothetical protein
MEQIYVFLYGSEWEDITILLSKEEAIEKSIQNPHNRVEIFSKTNESEYKPTYHYYKKGELIQNK